MYLEHFCTWFVLSFSHRDKSKIKKKPSQFGCISRDFESWGPFLQGPDNFLGPKSNIQIEIKRIRAQILASKTLHFILLTDFNW